MIGFSVQNRLLAGTPKDEDPIDVFYMCLGAALIHVRTKLTDGVSFSYRNDFEEALDPAVELMGKIFCPIYEVVKPDDYVANMEHARRSYSGIATSGDLQIMFTNQILKLEQKEALNSLEIAIEAEVWRFIGRPGDPEPMAQ